MGVQSLGAIFVRVRNLENSIPFYSALGLRLRGIEDWDPGRGATFFLAQDHDGWPLLTLIESDDVRTTGVHHFGLNSANVRDMHRDLKLSGYEVTPLSEWESPWNHHLMFDVNDPDGHVINIIEVTPLNQSLATEGQANEGA